MKSVGRENPLTQFTIFRFDSIPQDHIQPNIIHLLQYGSIRIGEIEFWNVQANWDFYYHWSEINVCFGGKANRENMLLYANKTLHEKAQRDTKCVPPKLFMFFFPSVFEISYWQCRFTACIWVCLCGEATYAREIKFHEMPFCDMLGFICVSHLQQFKLLPYYYKPSCTIPFSGYTERKRAKHHTQKYISHCVCVCVETGFEYMSQSIMYNLWWDL